MNCKCYCKDKSCVLDDLKKYVESQVKRKARKAYKLKELEEKAKTVDREMTSKLIDAELDCKAFLKEKFPELEEHIRIQYLSTTFRTDEWSAYYQARAKCDKAIKEETDRIMLGARCGKTYDEVITMVRELTFNTDEE